MGGVLHNRRAVHIDRDLPAESLIEQVVLGGRGEILTAADYMGDAHEMVVHNVGKVIGGEAVSLQQDLIVQGAVFHRDGAIDYIVEGGSAFQRHLLTDYIGFAGIQLGLNLLGGEVAAVAVILGSNARSLLQFPDLLQTLLVAEAVVSGAQLYQLEGIFLIDAYALTLYIGAYRAADIRTLVPQQAGVPHGVVDNIHGAFHLTLLVSILDPQDHFTAHALGSKIGIQGCPQVTDMHIAGRTGGKSGAYMIKFHGQSLRFGMFIDRRLAETAQRDTY